MSDERQADESLNERILAAAAVGYAVLDASGELIFSNLAFDRAAAAAGCEASHHAHCLIKKDGRVERTVTVRQLGESGERLIELIPADAAEVGVAEGIELDEVTGVLTRQAFLGRLSAALSRPAAEQIALIFLDLDGFKSINDRFGHLVGDACLREVGRRLSAVIRGDDAIGRFGGDEFLILLQGVDGPERFAPIAGRLNEAMEPAFAGPEGPLELRASLGVAYSEAGKTEIEGLIAEADRAMYASKRQLNGQMR